MRVFRSSSQVFFKIVRVCRQLHENFVCHICTCDVALHACVCTCMHTRYNAHTLGISIATSNSVQCASARDNNANMHVCDMYLHNLKMAHRLRVITLFSCGYSISSIRKRFIEGTSTSTATCYRAIN